jgi:hypothetical protein
MWELATIIFCSLEIVIRHVVKLELLNNIEG